MMILKKAKEKSATSATSKMYSCLFALISALFGVYVTAQSCGSSQLSAHTSSPSYLTSPNYPLNYPSSATCTWTITAPPGYVVELSFVTFETEGYFYLGSCSSSGDILEVYNGRYRFSSQLRGKYCSKYLPANVYSSGISLYLRFTSDSAVEEKGFKIKYRAVIPRPNSTICSPFNTFSQNNNIQVSGSSGYIESPLYGDKYPSSMQCTWVITVPDFKNINLTFTDFVVGGHSYCGFYSSFYDHVQIRDGRYSYSTSLQTLCGQRLPSPVYSRGRYMWIRFKSNSNNNKPRNATGFRAKFNMYEGLLTTSIPRTTDWRSTSNSLTGFEIVLVIIVCIMIFLVCVCVCFACSKRTPGHVNVRAPAVTQTTTVQGTQNQPGTTFQYPQQMQGFTLRPPLAAGSSPATQSSYPPQAGSGHPPPYQQLFLAFGSHVVPATGGNGTPVTGGGTPAPGYPPQSSPSVPMMPYPQQSIPDDPPPPYPGLPAEYLSQATTGQSAPSSPNPPPQDVQDQQTSSPYPPTQDITQASAPPPF